MQTRYFYLFLVLLFGLAACGSSASNTGTASTSTPTSAETRTPTPSNQHFKVGQVVKVGDTWQVTITSAKTSQGSQYLKPQHTGNVFLVLSIDVKNISQAEQTFSTYQFKLRDTSGQEYNQAAVPDPSSSTGIAVPPNGKIEAGAPLKGVFGFEVPASSHQFILMFEIQFLSSGQTIWDIKV